MPERKMTLRKARCGHIDVTVDMLYPLKSGEIKYLYTFKYIKIDVKYIRFDVKYKVLLVF